MMRCKNHDYMYYNESWQDETTGTLYRKGYYDETGTYYDADNIVFKGNSNPFGKKMKLVLTNCGQVDVDNCVVERKTEKKTELKVN